MTSSNSVGSGKPVACSDSVASSDAETSSDCGDSARVCEHPEAEHALQRDVAKGEREAAQLEEPRREATQLEERQRTPREFRVRLLNYRDVGEVRTFITLLYALSAEADPYHFEKTPEFIDRCVVKARREETPENTYAGLALAGREMVGVHLLRRLEEGPLVGVQVAGLWVAPAFRRRGIARTLKVQGEAWARSIGAHFVNSNVLAQNAAMLDLNRKLGFENYRVNLRKRL